MTEYFEARITDETDPEAPNREIEQRRYSAVKEPNSLKMKQKNQENRDRRCFALLSSILWLLASDPPQNAA